MDVDNSEFLARWSTVSGAEMIALWAAGELPSPAHNVHVGVSYEKAEPGRLTLAWRPSAALANPGGAVHGGYVSMVCDEAAGLACAIIGDRFRPHLTLDLHVEFVRPAIPGQLYRAVGEVVHAGKQRSLADATITDEAGRLVARGHAACVENRAAQPPG